MDISTFQKRKSIRRYADTKIEDSRLNELMQFTNQMPSLPNTTKRQLIWLTGKDWISDSLSQFLLSYGKLVTAPHILLPFYETAEDCDLLLGFEMEHVVLKAVDLGISTLWLSTEDQKAIVLESIQALQTNPGKWPDTKFLSKLPPNWENVFDEMYLPVVLLFGFPSEKRLDRIINNAIRMESAGNSRKKIETIITNRRQANLTENLKKILNLSILAPSKRNQQPWRVRINKNGFDVGYLHSRQLDIGIFLTHLKIAMDHFKIKHRIELFYEKSGDIEWKVKIHWK